MKAEEKYKNILKNKEKYVEEKYECDLGHDYKITLTYDRYRNRYHLSKTTKRTILYSDFVNDELAEVLKELFWKYGYEVKYD